MNNLSSGERNRENVKEEKNKERMVKSDTKEEKNEQAQNMIRGEMCKKKVIV